jgi:putative ABC transport system permease protein
MAGRVPLARRNLLADPRRLAASALAVGMAVMLILLLDGLWAGVRSQVTRYEDEVGAQLYVVAPGTRSLFAEGSTVPISALDVVRRAPGVDWASPVQGRFAILDLHGRKVATTLVGSVPGGRGGPWAIADGRLVELDGEAVLDEVLADRHDLAVGDPIEILGRPFQIVGLSRGTASFMTGFVFITHGAADALLRSSASTTAVLVGAARPGEVRAQLEAEGLTVLDHDELRQAGLALATQIYGTPLRLMVLVAFLAGTLVIALTAYTSVTERTREYGIVKAMGATRRRLTALAVVQTALLAFAGTITGVVLFAVGRVAITTARPQFTILLTSGAVLRAAGAAAVMGTIAALIPAHRLARLDPAVAYRGA